MTRKHVFEWQIAQRFNAGLQKNDETSPAGDGRIFFRPYPGLDLFAHGKPSVKALGYFSLVKLRAGSASR
jgi:hypothetical protein